MINLRRTLMDVPREIGAEGLVDLRPPRIPFANLSKRGPDAAAT